MIRLHYYRDAQNFGDLLSPLLVESVSGRKAVWAEPEEADMVGAGSVLYFGDWLFQTRRETFRRRGLARYLACRRRNRASAPVAVWGAGFLGRPDSLSGLVPLRRARFLAVRGRCSHDLLLRAGVCPTNEPVTYGDPGILADRLLSERPNRKFDVGIVPHLMDKAAALPVIRALASAGLKTATIDLDDPDPVNVLRRIASCETILSSSLHGCVVSDGLGIPNRQISFSTLGLDRDDYLLKFRDYFSALSLELPPPWLPADILDDPAALPRRIGEGYPVAKDKVAEVKTKLLESFPAEWTV